MRLITAILALALSAAAHAEYGSVVVDEYVRAYDGDTVTVSVDDWPDVIGDEISVRVRGVDTPEIRGDCPAEKERARAARDFVRERLDSADQVELRQIERGKYFRVVATVMVDGRDLADALTDRGLGREYGGGSRAGWCDQ